MDITVTFHKAEGFPKTEVRDDIARQVLNAPCHVKLHGTAGRGDTMSFYVVDPLCDTFIDCRFQAFDIFASILY